MVKFCVVASFFSFFSRFLFFIFRRVGELLCKCSAHRHLGWRWLLISPSWTVNCDSVRSPTPTPAPTSTPTPAAPAPAVAPLAFGPGHCSPLLPAVMTFHRLGTHSQSERARQGERERARKGERERVGDCCQWTDDGAISCPASRLRMNELFRT